MVTARKNISLTLTNSIIPHSIFSGVVATILLAPTAFAQEPKNINSNTNQTSQKVVKVDPYSDYKAKLAEMTSDDIVKEISKKEKISSDESIPFSEVKTAFIHQAFCRDELNKRTAEIKEETAKIKEETVEIKEETEKIKKAVALTNPLAEKARKIIEKTEKAKIQVEKTKK